MTRTWCEILCTAFLIGASFAFGRWQHSGYAGWFMFCVLMFIDTALVWVARWITTWHKEDRK